MGTLGDPTMRYVLVVDGNELVLRGLARALRSPDRHVLTTTRVAEAKSFVDEAQPEVVITDLKLPEQSGFHFIGWIRARLPALPVYVFTGVDSWRIAVRCGRLGATDYFVKTRDTSALIRTVGGTPDPAAAILEWRC